MTGQPENISGTFEFPEVDAIAAQLDRAKAARDKLDRAIAWLEEGVALFSGEPPKSELPAAAPPTRAAPSGPRPTGRHIEAKIMHAVLSAKEPLSRSEIAERVGVTVSSVKNPLQRVVRAGRIIAEGNTKNRVYRPAPHAPHSEHGARIKAGQERNAAQTADRVARVGLRARVMNTIAAHPGVNEIRIAALVDADRDDVAEATGWLLERDRIVLKPDGTYHRNGLKEVAA